MGLFGSIDLRVSYACQFLALLIEGVSVILLANLRIKGSLPGASQIGRKQAMHGHRTYIKRK